MFSAPALFYRPLRIFRQKKTFSLKAICRTKFICSCDTCTCVCIQQYVAFTYCSFLDTNYWFIQRLPLNFSKVPLSALFCGGVINLSLVKAKRSYKLIYSLPFCEVLKTFTSISLSSVHLVDFWKRKLNYIHKFPFIE